MPGRLTLERALFLLDEVNSFASAPGQMVIMDIDRHALNKPL